MCSGIKMTREMSSIIVKVRKNLGLMRIHMHSQTFQKKIVTYAETYLRDANKYQTWKKNAPKVGIFANIELFLIFT